jgi:hypothetical protein
MKGQITMLFFSRSQAKQRRRTRGIDQQSESIANFEILELRRLLSAVNDSATLPANSNSVAFNIFDNDSNKPNLWLDGYTMPKFGSVSIGLAGNASYGFMRPIKSQADSNNAQAAANNAITDWQAATQNNIASKYATIAAAIGRFGGFLNQWSTGPGWLGGIAGDALAIGNTEGFAAAGFALKLIANAYSEYVGSSMTVIIEAARQNAVDLMTAEFQTVQNIVQQLRSDLSAQLLLVPNPTFIGTDTFNYTEQELVFNGMMPSYTTTTATITITINRSDYTAMVNNVSSWIQAHSVQLNTNTIMPPETDITKVYGQMLYSFASVNGWMIQYHKSIHKWGGDSTDWPWIFDQEDVCQELNRIGYVP